TALPNDLAQQEGRERILRWRLEHHGCAAGDRGSQLMGGQQDRKVEWDDPGDGREGESASESPASLAVRLEVHGDNFATHPGGLFRTLAEDEDRAVDLGACQGQRLPRLGCQEASELLP